MSIICPASNRQQTVTRAAYATGAHQRKAQARYEPVM